mgnify:CR=1 FL=1
MGAVAPPPVEPVPVEPEDPVEPEPVPEDPGLVVEEPVPVEPVSVVEDPPEPEPVELPLMLPGLSVVPVGSVSLAHPVIMPNANTALKRRTNHFFIRHLTPFENRLCRRGLPAVHRYNYTA